MNPRSLVSALLTEIVEIPQMPQYEDNLDFELDKLCIGVAARFLRECDEADGGGVAGVSEFAVRTIREFEGGKMSEHFDDLVDDWIRLAEDAELERSVTEVGGFMVAMVNSSVVLRSNSRRTAAYNVLTAAVCALTYNELETYREPWTRLLADLASADSAWEQALEETPEDFRKKVTKAFKDVLKHPNFSFPILAKSIRGQQNRAVILRLRRKLCLRCVGRRSSDTSSESANSYE
jgi:hypothetical protein